MTENNNIIDSNYNGIVVIRAKNALFNAGFDGLPRTLPSGQIFATDKAFKYCIREYLRLFKNENIFVSRHRHIIADKNGKKYGYDTLEQNYEFKLNKKIPTNNDEEIMNDLKSFVDIRLFGIVFALKVKSNSDASSNISFTGPVQINYGLDQFEDDNGKIISTSILSPYSDKRPVQTTIGNQNRVSEAYYVYDVSVNKANAEKTGLTESDLDLLKEALKYSVNAITSNTKFGCDIVSNLWFKNKENKIYNNLNQLVNISKDEKGIINIDYSKVLKHINLTRDDVEIYNLDKTLFMEKLE